MRSGACWRSGSTCGKRCRIWMRRLRSFCTGEFGCRQRCPFWTVVLDTHMFSRVGPERRLACPEDVGEAREQDLEQLSEVEVLLVHIDSVA